jgi:hypothetical protein
MSYLIFVSALCDDFYLCERNGAARHEWRPIVGLVYHGLASEARSTICFPASYLTTFTGVPNSTASKNRLAFEPGIRIQP